MIKPNIDPAVRAYFNQEGIQSIDTWNSSETWYWCEVRTYVIRLTKRKRPYIKMVVAGDSGQELNCFIWVFDPSRDSEIPNNTIILAKFKKASFGLSTHFSRIDVIEER